MRTIIPAELPHRDFHNIFLSCIAPRPIALVATISADGSPNLSPFSFFNAFSSRPPVVVFSPAYRAQDGSAKDTLLNLLSTGECTISAVTYNMVEQISLASCNYAHGVDEFVKSGLTPLPSTMVAPPGVAESPFIMECKLLQHVELDVNIPSRGNLMVCEVLRIQISESVFDGEKIDPRRLDLAARMGYDWYCRANGDAVFEVPKPKWNGIGFDALPDFVRNSSILTGNDLAKLAGAKVIPQKNAEFPDFTGIQTSDNVERELLAHSPLRALYALWHGKTPRDSAEWHLSVHRTAQSFLDKYDIESAWQTLFLSDGEKLG